MPIEQCPLCSGSLEARETSPCHQCGADPGSVERFNSGEHTYHAVKLFGDQELILCDSCMLNFGSFDPEFFGQSKTTPIGFEHMQILRQIQNPSSRPDMFCSSCGFRLRFLNFIKDSRKGASA